MIALYAYFLCLPNTWNLYAHVYVFTIVFFNHCVVTDQQMYDYERWEDQRLMYPLTAFSYDKILKKRLRILFALVDLSKYLA